MISFNKLKSWLPTLSLSFAGFIFVTTEFIPVGLLPDIAESFGRTISFTGLLMTIYAWIVATMSLPLTILSSKINRRTLSLTLLVFFILAHLIAALALNFQMLLLSRILIALTHAVFWSITTPLAVRVAPAGQQAKALAMVVGGASLGNVLGIPFGTFLGHNFGWRMAFMAIGICALLVFTVIYKSVPSLPSSNSGSWRSLNKIFKNPAIVLVYLLTCITVTGHFTAFTYINPFMQNIGGYDSDWIPPMLLIFGLAGFFGSFVGGKYVAKNPKTLVLIALLAMMSCLLLLKFAVISVWLMSLLVFVWGSVLTIGIISFQTIVLTQASEAADVANSLYSGIFNIGIGGGALIGSLFSVNHLETLGYIGAGFIFISVLLSLGLPNSIKWSS